MLRCRRYSYDLIPAVDWLESDMTIAPTLQKHIEAHGVAFEIVEHDRTTYTSSETAHASHVSGDYIAKAVLLRDEQGGHLLAVLPATHHVHFGDLGRWLGRHLPLASEGEIKLVFEDCAMGAIPAIAGAYGLDAIVDDSLKGTDEVFLEGGDHRKAVSRKWWKFEDGVISG